MHAGRPRGEFLNQIGPAAETTPDFARASVGALGARLELAFVREALTTPAAKALAAIKDPAPASTSRALKPPTRPAERCGCIQVLNRLLHVLPRTRRGANPKGQLKALRQGKEAYGAERLAISGPVDHTSMPRL